MMRSRRGKVMLASGALIIAAAVAVAVVFATRSSKASPAATHRAYAELFASATILQTRISVLDRWPKPYQIYHDAYFHKCYEWWDKPLFLYNLCFDKTNGLLVNKELT
jgi:hypothetical protein